MSLAWAEIEERGALSEPGMGRQRSREHSVSLA